MQVRVLTDLNSTDRAALLDRDIDLDSIHDDVRAVIDEVRDSGDAALRAFSREFDDVDIDRIEITDHVPRAQQQIPESLAAAISTAAENIRAFHEHQCRDDWMEEFNGRELGRRFRPIEHVGAYVPGGTATYPSSALMTLIPARVAGVQEISVATPPADSIPPATLAAIDAAGADHVYGIGGAQAIAALAYGTETIDPVGKIVGPGNQWVTAAKAAVRNDVAIDFLAGPSEILVIADHTASPGLIAADMVAQAEHDPHASAVLLTDDPPLGERVVDELERQISGEPREDIIRSALTHAGSGVFVVDSIERACAFAEEYGPEHLSVQTEDEDLILDSVPSVGSVFLGEYTPVAAGDYASGTNHVLPTGGMAHVTGGLSVDSFLRATTIQRLDRESLGALRPTITALAAAEGFHAHERSVETRFSDE